MTAHELEQHLKTYTGTLNPDEGILFGDATAEMKKVQVCFMATVEAIQHAIEIGVDTILAHEALFYPYPGIRNGIPPQGAMAWPANRERTRLLSEGGITVLRYHGSMDRVCIRDVFAQKLSLGKPVVQGESTTERVYEVEPCTLDEMIDRVKAAFDLDSVRMSGAHLNPAIRRVGLAWGGIGLFVNVGAVAGILRHGVDVLIGGETDEYGMLFATDAGVPFIETAHSVSENPGIKHFAGMLAKDLPDLGISYFENRRAWENR
jgi:putative NIF3 family GTP cyclohydrolase 1 type 2